MFDHEFDQALFEFEQTSPAFEPLFALAPQSSSFSQYAYFQTFFIHAFWNLTLRVQYFREILFQVFFSEIFFSLNEMVTSQMAD